MRQEIPTLPGLTILVTSPKWRAAEAARLRRVKKNKKEKPRDPFGPLAARYSFWRAFGLNVMPAPAVRAASTKHKHAYVSWGRPVRSPISRLIGSPREKGLRRRAALSPWCAAAALLAAECAKDALALRGSRQSRA